jgi:hypothetical protein
MAKLNSSSIVGTVGDGFSRYEEFLEGMMTEHHPVLL